jgi:hypothetical protein
VAKELIAKKSVEFPYLEPVFFNMTGLVIDILIN